MSDRIIVTGCAGFIGMHCAERLLDDGHIVIGIDNLNDYYDVNLKKARLARLEGRKGFSWHHADIASRERLQEVFAEAKPVRVLHLAAQAGVRRSIEVPDQYTDSNLLGFANLLQQCRMHHVEHLVFASSSSVYGGNTKVPYSENDAVDHPISYYAATKKANEVMAHSFAHIYGIPCTGLRFFTVYGPWGRPDMALFKFTKAILEGQTIDVYGEGRLTRDFTYIDDVAKSTLLVLNKTATPDEHFDALAPNPGTAKAPFRIFNIGNRRPVILLDFIHALESALGMEARKNMLPIQPGDMRDTAADTTALSKWIGFAPDTPVTEGVARFVQWYREFYGK